MPLHGTPRHQDLTRHDVFHSKPRQAIAQYTKPPQAMAQQLHAMPGPATTHHCMPARHCTARQATVQQNRQQKLPLPPPPDKATAKQQQKPTVHGSYGSESQLHTPVTAATIASSITSAANSNKRLTAARASCVLHSSIKHHKSPARHRCHIRYCPCSPN